LLALDTRLTVQLEFVFGHVVIVFEIRDGSTSGRLLQMFFRETPFAVLDGGLVDEFTRARRRNALVSSIAALLFAAAATSGFIRLILLLTLEDWYWSAHRSTFLGCIGLGKSIVTKLGFSSLNGA
jgi:hypothetical protein